MATSGFKAVHSGSAGKPNPPDYAALSHQPSLSVQNSLDRYVHPRENQEVASLREGRSDFGINGKLVPRYLKLQ